MSRYSSSLIKLIITFFTLSVFQVQAAVIYDESISGDLTGNLASPDVLSLSVGSNTVLGNIGDNGFDGATNGQDADYFTFTLSGFSQVTSITIDSYTSTGSVAQTASFLGYRAGSSFSGQGFSDIDDFVLFSATSGEVLDDLTGSLTPLGAGSYAFWFQETAANSLIDYSITFEVVNAVPVPAALPLFLSAVAGLGFIRRKD